MSRRAHPPLVRRLANPHHERVSIYARPGSVILPDVPNRFTGLVSRAVLLVAIFGVPLAMACARVFETPSSSLGWSRLCVSLAALVIIAIARRRDFARRLLLAFMLEAASGITTFAYVDLPFVTDHTNAIAGGVASAYARMTHRDIRVDLVAL